MPEEGGTRPAQWRIACPVKSLVANRPPNEENFHPNGAALRQYIPSLTIGSVIFHLRRKIGTIDPQQVNMLNMRAITGRMPASRRLCHPDAMRAGGIHFPIFYPISRQILLGKGQATSIYCARVEIVKMGVGGQPDSTLVSRAHCSAARSPGNHNVKALTVYTIGKASCLLFADRQNYTTLRARRYSNITVLLILQAKA
jgi:hypothetical protein